tara:strand:- start:459 stop:1283 length:825 start_codon:yes stop_codon:yes gene_type:complete
MKHIILILVFTLTACTVHHSTLEENNDINFGKKNEPTAKERLKDGPPSFKSKKTQTSAYPKLEPYSRYGNRASYDVDGRQYHVLASSHGYKARGIASWYGTKFHQKNTSSGESYDLYAMTAAHKTLPLPTYVKVKNIVNNREVVVKVNDRGPFHENRIIDLSYGAAKKLDILEKGTGLVEIEAIHPPGFDNTPLKYFIQIGAYSRKEMADKRASEITSLTHKPSFLEFHDELYIVKTGPFETPAELEESKIKLAKFGINDIFTVLQKTNLLNRK